MRIGRGKYDLRFTKIVRADVFAFLECKAPVGCGKIAELDRNFGRNDFHVRAGLEECQCLTGSYLASADHDRMNALAIEGDRQRAQRNCPLSSVLTRNTTYMIITLANVMAEITAARRA